MQQKSDTTAGLLSAFGAELLYLAAGRGLALMGLQGEAAALIRTAGAALPVIGWARAAGLKLGLCRPRGGVVAPAGAFCLLAAAFALMMPRTPHSAGGIWTGVQLCLAAPLAEELVFRGAVQGFLQPLGGRTAVLVQAFLFAVQHSGAAGMLYAACMGLVLGWLRQRSASVLPGCVLHIVNNLLVLLAG